MQIISAADKSFTVEVVEAKGFLCHPVPGSSFQSYDSRLSTMPRDELHFNMKRARTWPRGQNVVADAVMAEWNGRYEHWAAQANAAAAAATAAKAEAETEFRTEVIDAMVEAGIARHVAANLTNTERKLLDAARKYGVI